MAIQSYPGVGPQNTDIANAVALAVPNQTAINTAITNFGKRQYQQTITSSTTWVAPANTYSVDVVMAGGGGGGGAAYGQTTNHGAVGGGGGGGELTKTQVSVTPGNSYTVVIGAGGSGATSTSTNGGNGGDTKFGLVSTLANGITYDTNMFASVIAGVGSGKYNSGTTAYNFNTYPWFYAQSWVYPGGWFNKGTSSVTAITSPPSYGQGSQWGQASFANFQSAFYATAPAGHCGVSLNIYVQSTQSMGEWLVWSPVTASTAYTASTYIWNPASATQEFSVRIEWYVSYQGTFISATQSTTSVPTLGAWSLKSHTATAPANATYALIRYMAWCPVGGGIATFYLTNSQFEQGSSVTAYKGPFYGTGKWTQSGILNVTDGAVASGGGGGGSAQWEGTNNYVGATMPNPGGGPGYAANGDGTTEVIVGGNGGGYSDCVSPQLMRHQSTTAAQSIASIVPQARAFPSPVVKKASDSYTINGTTIAVANAHLGSASSASPEGLCAGGGGGFNSMSGAGYLYMVPPLTANGAGISGYSYAGLVGGNARANTGSGGGGATAWAGGVTNAGGNGGSGIVYLSWWA